MHQPVVLPPPGQQHLLPVSRIDNIHCYMTDSKVISLAETACKSFVQKLMLDCSSLICEQSDDRNPKTIFSCQAALTKVMSTCLQLFLDLISGIPKLFFCSQASLTKVMCTCPQLNLVLK